MILVVTVPGHRVLYENSTLLILKQTLTRRVGSKPQTHRALELASRKIHIRQPVLKFNRGN